MFFHVNAAEKSWLACATGAAILALPSNLARSARSVELMVPGDFLLSSLLMLCYCVLHVLRHFVQWNWCITGVCSTVACCKSIALCTSVSADRIGMAASRFLAVAAAGVILVCLAAASRKSYCDG